MTPDYALVNLSWTSRPVERVDVGTWIERTEYRLPPCEGTCGVDVPGRWTVIAKLGPSVESFEDVVPKGQGYCYRLYAVLEFQTVLGPTDMVCLTTRSGGILRLPDRPTLASGAYTVARSRSSRGPTSPRSGSAPAGTTR